MNASTPLNSTAPGRRVVLKGVAGLGAAGATITLLTGCGGGESGTAGQGAADVAAITAAAQQAVANGEVGAGKPAFLSDVNAILTEPTPGNYMVFSDACTHEGGKVSQVTQQGMLACPLHGAQFDPATGDAVAGPTQQALQKLDVPVA